MTASTRKELKTAAWVFVGSIAFTPLLLWGFVAFVLGRDFDFQNDYLEFYRAMFSLHIDMVGTWLIVLAPVLLYEVVVTAIYYWRHPERLRSVFEFPKRK
jgi:hypothetical protein